MSDRGTTDIGHFLRGIVGVRKDGALVAIVDNEVLKSPWKVGHEIVVLPEHVLETSDPNYMTFARKLAFGVRIV